MGVYINFGSLVTGFNSMFKKKLIHGAKRRTGKAVVNSSSFFSGVGRDDGWLSK